MTKSKKYVRANEARVRDTVHWFSVIYLGGIPTMITAESAFLAFICVATAIDALASYRYRGGSTKSRYVNFIKTHFPDEYTSLAEDFYELRNKLVHAFSTGAFELTHHRSDLHLGRTTRGKVVLNAEDTYAALVFAARKYFEHLRQSDDLKSALLDRLEASGGGSIGVHTIAVM